MHLESKYPKKSGEKLGELLGIKERDTSTN